MSKERWSSFLKKTEAGLGSRHLPEEDGDGDDDGEDDNDEETTQQQHSSRSFLNRC